MKRKIPRVIVLLLPALFCLACAGGRGDDASSSAASDSFFDPKRAADQTHATLLTPTDLPAAGWQVVQDDAFDKASDIPDIGHCSEMRRFQEEGEKDIAGRAQRHLATSNSDGLPDTRVEVKVVAYHQAGRLPGMMKTSRSFTTSDTYSQCLVETLRGQLGAAAQIDMKRATAAAPAPYGGAALAIELDVATSLQSARLRLESYTWLRNNTVFSLQVTGPPAAVTPNLVNTALQKVQAKAEAAAK